MNIPTHTLSLRWLVVAMALFAVVSMGLITWLHLGWEEAERSSLIPLDSLSVARRAVLTAELYAERRLAGDESITEGHIVASLERAVAAIRSVREGSGGFAYGVMASEDDATLAGAVQTHEANLNLARDRILAYITSPQARTRLELRAMYGELERSSNAVETELLRGLRQRHDILDYLTATLIASVALFGVAVLGALLRAERRRERAAQALGTSEQTMRAFASSVPGVSFMVNRAGVYVGVFGNDNNLLAVPREGLVGRALHEIFPSEQAEFFLAIVVRALDTGRTQQCEYEIALPAGPRWFEARVSPTGEPEVVVWLGWDITERKRAEERIRLHAAALESTRDGVIVTDLADRIVSVNRAFSTITGYAEQEVLGHTPAVLKSPRHDEHFHQALREQTLAAGSWQGEVWNLRKNGELYPQWTSISTVLGDNGRPSHYVTVFTDITLIKQAEERLSRLAHFDPLTDLPNRAMILSQLTHAVARAERNAGRVGVMFIDLDNFKDVNDALGHAQGDELLIKVGRRITQRMRRQDTLGRLGGDEFVLVLEDVHTAQDCAGIAQMLIDALSAPYTLSSGHAVHVQASIGISIHPDDACHAADLVRAADAAMYEAKRAGRSTYRHYSKTSPRSQ